jgi:hypothetical protein
MVALFVNASGLFCVAGCGMYGTDGAHPSEGESWARFAAEGPALSVRGKRVLRFKFISFKSRCVTERPALSVRGFFQVSSFTSPVFLLGE